MGTREGGSLKKFDYLLKAVFGFLGKSVTMVIILGYLL